MTLGGPVDVNFRRFVVLLFLVFLRLVCLRLYIGGLRVLSSFLLPWLRRLNNSPKLIRAEVAELKCKAYECENRRIKDCKFKVKWLGDKITRGTSP